MIKFLKAHHKFSYFAGDLAELSVEDEQMLIDEKFAVDATAAEKEAEEARLKAEAEAAEKEAEAARLKTEAEKTNSSKADKGDKK